jgi:hypothetical protein
MCDTSFLQSVSSEAKAAGPSCVRASRRRPRFQSAQFEKTPASCGATGGARRSSPKSALVVESVAQLHVNLPRVVVVEAAKRQAVVD